MCSVVLSLSLACARALCVDLFIWESICQDGNRHAWSKTDPHWQTNLVDNDRKNRRRVCLSTDGALLILKVTRRWLECNASRMTNWCFFFVHLICSRDELPSGDKYRCSLVLNLGHKVDQWCSRMTREEEEEEKSSHTQTRSCGCAHC